MVYICSVQRNKEFTSLCNFSANHFYVKKNLVDQRMLCYNLIVMLFRSQRK